MRGIGFGAQATPEPGVAPDGDRVGGRLVAAVRRDDTGEAFELLQEVSLAELDAAAREVARKSGYTWRLLGNAIEMQRRFTAEH